MSLIAVALPYVGETYGLMLDSISQVYAGTRRHRDSVIGRVVLEIIRLNPDIGYVCGMFSPSMRGFLIVTSLYVLGV